MLCIYRKGLFVLLFAFSMLLLSHSIYAQDVIAYLGEVSGDVIITRGTPEAEETAVVGMFLYAGDRIKTAENSYTSVIFQDDGSRIKLASNSQLTLNAARQKKTLSKRLFLNAGKVWAKVTKTRGTDFQVTTPTSVASVKGTRFALEEKEWGETWLWVVEDSVELRNRTGQIVVNQGEKGIATEDTLRIESIQEDDLPVEPGPHTIIFYLTQEDDPLLQKEVHIEFER